MNTDLHQRSSTKENSNVPKFKPITQGLGLNHFADGLPYQTSKKFKTPTIQPKRMVQFNFPVQKQIQNQVKVQEQKLQETSSQTTVESAGFFLKSTSYLIDVGVTLFLFWMIVFGSFAITGISTEEILSSRSPIQVLWPLVLLYVVVYLSYFLIQETTWRKTIGKAIMGLQIKSPSGFSAGARTFCFLLSFIPFGLGLFWQFFDGKKRCWHDLVTESQVVHEIHS